MNKLGLLFFALLFFFFACSSDKKDAGQNEENFQIVEEKPVQVKAKLLEYTDFHYEVISNGTIVAMNKADLFFQSQELLTQIYVRNGQRVTKGQKIAELDKFKLENNMRQALEALQRAELDFQDVLIGQGYSLSDTANIPQDIIKIARIKSNYEQSLNTYTLSQYELDAATLYAPFDGVIANMETKVYNLPGTEAFCTLIDNRQPEVVFNILENELSLINLNDKVIISPFSMNDYSVEGRITEINPAVDKNGMVRIKASVNNKDNKFYEGMNVKVRVQRLLGKQLVIPKSALVLRTNRKVVFTMEEDRAVWNNVQVLHENTDSYVISEGLSAGSKIIYEGVLNLSHGARVTDISN